MSFYEELADKFEIENKRKWTALRVSRELRVPYETVYKVLTELGVHGNWTKWEIQNRPVDIDEMTDIVSEYLS